MASGKNGHAVDNGDSISPQSVELPLSALLAQRCKQFANSPKAREIIDSGIEDMFKAMVSTTFRSEGDFGKQMLHAFKAALPTNAVDLLDLRQYNSLVLQSIREAWAASSIKEDMVERMTDLVTEFSNDKIIPKFILASELWAAFIDGNEVRAIEERWKKPQVVVSKFDNDDYIWIGLHPEQSSNPPYSSGTKSSTHECDFMLAFSAKYSHDHDSKVPVIEDGKPVYELFAGHMESGVLGKTVVHAYSRFDKLVLALYYGGSLLLWDYGPEEINYLGCHE